MKKIDKLDKKLLAELQKDCSQKIRTLSDHTRVPMSTIHNRLKKYKKEGIIKAFRAVLNDEYLGSYITAFVLIDAKKVSNTSLGSEGISIQVSRMDHVQECHVLQGTYDLIVKIKAPTIADIHKLTHKISLIDGVADIDVFIALKTRKETTQIDLD